MFSESGIRQVYGNHKRRAAGLGIETEFTLGELIGWWGLQPKLCECGAPANSLDHIHPLSRGGRHSLVNLQLLCGPCNSRKAAFLPGEPRIYPWDAPGFVSVPRSQHRPRKAIERQGGWPRFFALPDGRVYRFEKP